MQIFSLFTKLDYYHAVTIFPLMKLVVEITHNIMIEGGSGGTVI